MNGISVVTSAGNVIGDIAVRAASIAANTPFSVSDADRFGAIDAAYKRIVTERQKNSYTGIKADSAIILHNLAALVA